VEEEAEAVQKVEVDGSARQTALAHTYVDRRFPRLQSILLFDRRLHDGVEQRFRRHFLSQAPDADPEALKLARCSTSVPTLRILPLSLAPASNSSLDGTFGAKTRPSHFSVARSSRSVFVISSTVRSWALVPIGSGLAGAFFRSALSVGSVRVVPSEESGKTFVLSVSLLPPPPLAHAPMVSPQRG
jgi:hypothetical protein